MAYAPAAEKICVAAIGVVKACVNVFNAVVNITTNTIVIETLAADWTGGGECGGGSSRPFPTYYKEFTYVKRIKPQGSTTTPAQG